METIAFDTLKLSRKLEASGFTHEQAVGAAEALSETFGDSLVTKRDLKHETGIIRNEIELAKRDLTIRLGGMMVTGIVVVAALVKLL